MKCPTKNCDEIISERSKLLFCKNCRAGMYYASKQPRGYAQARATHLAKLQDRITNVRSRKETKT